MAPGVTTPVLAFNAGGNEAKVPYLSGLILWSRALRSASAEPMYVKYLGSHDIGADLMTSRDKILTI